MAIDPRYQAVHHLTASTGINGTCMTKVRQKSYWARERRYFPDGSFEMMAVRVPDVMSKECRNFYLWDAPECAGCEFPRDIEYQKRMEQA